MTILEDVSLNLQKGKAKVVKELVQQALDEGIEAKVILEEGLMSGMTILGEKFQNNEVFVPEVLVAARAMNMGVNILKPALTAGGGAEVKGKVAIGTIKGDLHDIGKNLVAMMMSNYGFDVHDLGKDVDKTTIIDAALEYNAQIICLSALMTTTMQYMKEVVELANEKCPDAKVIIGGAATTQSYADEIGAAGYSEDAVGAVALVKRLLKLE